jgi:predicted nucleic acid-binding protein
MLESLDTNVLLRFTVRDVEHQYLPAKKLILDAPRGRFLVADVAIAEYVFALSGHYKKNRHQIAEMLRYLMSLPQLVISRTVFEETLDLYTEHPKLSFDDCYLAAQAGYSESVPLWTFDKKLAKQSAAAKLVS